MVKPSLHSLSLIEAFRRSGFQGKVGILLAGWFFAGLFPVAPGTFGTICSIPLVALICTQPPLVKGIAVLVLLIAAFWSAHQAQRIMGGNDPSQVVIDEVVGFLVTMLFLPLGWRGLLVGFLLFRAFDIFKPFPIRWLETRVPGGGGIVVDDLAAGLYSGIMGKILFILIGQ